MSDETKKRVEEIKKRIHNALWEIRGSGPVFSKQIRTILEAIPLPALLEENEQLRAASDLMLAVNGELTEKLAKAEAVVEAAKEIALGRKELLGREDGPDETDVRYFALRPWRPWQKLSDALAIHQSKSPSEKLQENA